MVFVVSVHTLSIGGGAVTMSVGAVTTIFHTSRELFILLTALVLTYNYGQRPMKLFKFWRRRFWLVVPAYVVWSLIYYWADGKTRGKWPSAFIHDLENAGARYHLYFLLVSMQIYLLFPFIRWVLKKTERFHAWLFAIALAYQIWLTIGLHYKVGRHGNGDIAQFLNGAELGYWITTYAGYVVLGALAGWHFERLCAVTRRVLNTGWKAASVAAIGVIAGISVFMIEVEVYNATPNNASAVFQPVVVFEALTFGWALLAAGLMWSDRGAPGRKFASAGSDSSFGIYLGHPLMLQVLLLVFGWSIFGANGGLVGDLHRMTHSSIEVVVLLLIVMPVVYAAAWILASVARRTPFSLALTGREYQGRRFVTPYVHTGLDRAGFFRLVSDANQRAGVSRRWWTVVNRLDMTKWPRLAVVSTLVAAVVLSVAGYKTVDYVSQLDAKTTTTTHYLSVGGLDRNYTVIAPKAALPASAPIIMVLSGLNAGQQQEITRDEFLPYATAGEAELVYPLAYRESWNALGCCSYAAIKAVDDIGFITQVVHEVDPDDTRPIYLMGYSNGGRLAYRLACTNPLLFNGTIVVKADPQPGCAVLVPMNIMTVASTDDNRVPYKPGDKGLEAIDATTEIKRLRTVDGCSTKAGTTRQGNMTYTLWSDCFNGTTAATAVYTAGLHSFPRPPVSNPPVAEAIWSFITGTSKVAPLPVTKP